MKNTKKAVSGKSSSETASFFPEKGGWEGAFFYFFSRSGRGISGATGSITANLAFYTTLIFVWSGCRTPVLLSFPNPVKKGEGA